MAKNKFLSFSPKQPSNEFSCKTKNFQKAFLNFRQNGQNRFANLVCLS